MAVLEYAPNSKGIASGKPAHHGTKLPSVPSSALTLVSFGCGFGCSDRLTSLMYFMSDKWVFSLAAFDNSLWLHSDSLWGSSLLLVSPRELENLYKGRVNSGAFRFRCYSVASAAPWALAFRCSRPDCDSPLANQIASSKDVCQLLGDLNGPPVHDLFGAPTLLWSIRH